MNTPPIGMTVRITPWIQNPGNILSGPEIEGRWSNWKPLTALPEEK